MNFWKKAEGTISIFLVIILVPCLFVSALFVDVGRLYLSQGMAYSSADLALNTVLTKYDADLNEWYGLVASCQNMEEFYEVSEDYFMRTISSQNLEEDEIALMEQMYQNMIRQIQGVDPEGVSDLLRVEEVEDVEILPYTDANLTNPTLLKEQIVEFMKYRGPITVTTELLSMIMNESGDNISKEFEFLLDAESDENIIEAKKEFHNSESEFLSEAYNSYSYLYQMYSEKEIKNSDLQEMIYDLEVIRILYQEIHNTMFYDLFNTGELDPFNRPQVELNHFEGSYYYQYIASYVETPEPSEDEEDTSESAEPIYYISQSDLSSRATNLQNAITAFDTAKDNFCASVSGIPYSEKTYDIQYWCQTADILEGRKGNVDYWHNLAVAAENMIREYEYVKETLKLTAAPDVQASTLMTCNSLLNEVAARQSKYLVQYNYSTAGTDKYLILVERLERISADHTYDVIPSEVELSNGLKIDKSLTTSATRVTQIRGNCQMYVDILTMVIDGGTDGEKTIVSLDDLLVLAQAYETSFDNYCSETENADDSAMKTQAQSEIDELLQETASNDEKFAKVSSETVREMKTRLSNIRAQYQSVIDLIDSMTYGGKGLTKIKNYSTFRTCADTVVDENAIGLEKSVIEANSKNAWEKLFAPTKTTKEKLVELNETDSYNLFLVPEMDAVEMPVLYRFLFETFGAPDDAKVQEVKDEMTDAENTAEEIKEKQKDNISKILWNKNAEKIEAGVSGDGGVGFEGLSDSVASMSDIIKDFVTFDFDNMRDNLYIALYIMEMFSSATHENEGLYERYKEKGTNAITELNKSVSVTDAYSSVNKEESGLWLSTSTVDSYNKSMTNKLINQTNNPGYRCEVEYILYGKQTNKENIDAAYSDIFAIRLLLNTVSGFVNFWSDGTNTGKVLNTVADVVSSASLGVVPPAAIKLVLIMVMVALETCNDMNRLALGFPVELYKSNEKNWQLALSIPSGDGEGISSITTKIQNKLTGNPTNNDEGLFYSDYITLFICILASNESKCEDMMQRVADVLQFNMRNVTENETYQLANAHTHFLLTAKLRVDPLIVDIPLFDEYNEDLKSSTGWMEYNINAIRGY